MKTLSLVLPVSLTLTLLAACAPRHVPPGDSAAVAPVQSFAAGPDADEADGLRGDDPLSAARFRYEQRLGEDGTIPDNAWLIAKRQRDEMLAAQSPTGGFDPRSLIWTWLGPGNIGGRIRSIVIHPTTPTTMWLGSVGGGVWKTTDGGASWLPQDDFWPSLSVGCMAIDHTNPNVLYAGTGEGFFDTVEGSSNTAAIRGAGIFKTTNGGTTWSQLASTAGPNWYFVNRLAISPASSQIILAATNTGIYRSTDGGASWTQATAIKTLDVRFHPTDGTKAVAGRDDGMAQYSLDGGVTWTNVTISATATRIELTYARSSPATVYAGVSEADAIKVYRSIDGGQTYTLRTSGSGIGTYSSYNNAIWVDPTNVNLLIVGGVNLYRSTDGGVTLASAFTSVHSDHHVLVEHPSYDGVNNRTIYFGNDGGIRRALNAVSGTTTTSLNNNLGITQFYGAAVNAASGVVLAGAQDNGTDRYTGGVGTWTSTFGGDGGYCAADPTDPNYFYGEVQRAAIFRSTNGGSSANYIYNANAAAPLTDTGTLNMNFIPYFLLDPNNPNRMLVGGRLLWRSNDVKSAAPSWSSIKATIEPGPQPIPPPGDGGIPGDHFAENSPWNISTIAIAEGDPDNVWVGYNNGQLWRSHNGASSSPSWTRIDTNGAGPPARWISRIVIDRRNESRVYVSTMGWASNNIWRSINGGINWTEITGTSPAHIPSTPVSALAQHRRIAQWLYAGTDIGLYVSRDDGQTWSATTEGPGTVTVDELVWKDDRTLMAVTHGRGIFTADVAPLAGDLNCDGVVNALDVPAFVLALLDPNGYAAAYPGCDVTLADMNTDTAVDGGDLQGFVSVIVGP